MNTGHLKLLFIISLCFIFINTYAQKRLINREIYNFEVGDILHFSHISSFYDFTRFYKREVLSKEFSNNQDSVTYMVLDSIYELVSIPNFKLSVRYDTITYINLDSFPSPTSSSYDSTHDRCGTTMYIANYSIKPNGKQYTELYTDTYMEGLGRYYSLRIDSYINRSENSTLKYYKTKDKECGWRIGNLSTYGISYYKEMDIYPNPSNDRIKINWGLLNNYHSGVPIKIYIIDQFGKSVLYLESNLEELDTIDISSISSGIHTLCINFDEVNLRFKIIKL